MASINRLKPGQTVWEIKKQKVGRIKDAYYNECFEVVIREINLDYGYVLASWNGNEPKKFYEDTIRKWRVNEPQPKKQVWGRDSY